MELDPQALEELLIWQASDLAKRKRYSEAIMILKLFEGSEGKSRASACCLLGKIMAHQKRYTEAKAYFQKAIAFNPADSELQDALSGLPGYQRYRQILKWGGFVLPALLLGISGIFFIWLRHPGQDVATATKPAPSVSVAAEPHHILWPVIDIAGIKSIQRAEDMRITFDRGIFSDKCTLAPGSSSLIRTIAESIKRSSQKYLVIIEGHTDDLPVIADSPFKDNVHLGLMRANKILDLFHYEYGFPLSSLIAASAGETLSSHSNGRDEDRLNNRTISIRILPLW